MQARNPIGGIGRQARRLGRVEAARGDGQADVALLNEVLHRRSRVAELGRDLDDQAEVRMDQGGEGTRVGLAASSVGRALALLRGTRSRWRSSSWSAPWRSPFLAWALVQSACLLGRRPRAAVGVRKSAPEQAAAGNPRHRGHGKTTSMSRFDTPAFPKMGKKVPCGTAKNARTRVRPILAVKEEVRSAHARPVHQVGRRRRRWCCRDPDHARSRCRWRTSCPRS